MILQTLRRPFLALCLTCGLALLAPLLAVPAAADDETDSQTFVRNLADNAIITVADHQLSDTERNERFRRLFVSSFDLPEIGKFVLSRFWRQATPDQQAEFLKLFEDYTVLTWARRFKDYSGEKLETLGAIKDGDKGWVVDSHILRPNNAPPIAVQWRLKKGDDGTYRIIDIVVEGVSMAITQRSDYASAMQANGGRMDSLLSALRSKIDQMRATG